MYTKPPIRQETCIGLCFPCFYGQRCNQAKSAPLQGLRFNYIGYQTTGVWLPCITVRCTCAIEEPACGIESAVTNRCPIFDAGASGGRST